MPNKIIRKPQYRIVNNFQKSSITQGIVCQKSSSKVKINNIPIIKIHYVTYMLKNCQSILCWKSQYNCIHCLILFDRKYEDKCYSMLKKFIVYSDGKSK